MAITLTEETNEMFARAIMLEDMIRMVGNIKYAIEYNIESLDQTLEDINFQSIRDRMSDKYHELCRNIAIHNPSLVNQVVKVYVASKIEYYGLNYTVVLFQNMPDHYTLEIKSVNRAHER